MNLGHLQSYNFKHREMKTSPFDPIRHKPQELITMNAPFTLLITALISAGAIVLVFFAARQLIKVYGDNNQSTSIESQPLPDLCDCEAGSGKKGRYYHAITCRYRQALEHEP